MKAAILTSASSPPPHREKVRAQHPHRLRVQADVGKARGDLEGLGVGGRAAARETVSPREVHGPAQNLEEGVGLRVPLRGPKAQPLPCLPVVSGFQVLAGRRVSRGDFLIFLRFGLGLGGRFRRRRQKRAALVAVGEGRHGGAAHSARNRRFDRSLFPGIVQSVRKSRHGRGRRRAGAGVSRRTERTATGGWPSFYFTAHARTFRDLLPALGVNPAVSRTPMETSSLISRESSRSGPRGSMKF